MAAQDMKNAIIDELVVMQRKATQDKEVFKARAYGKVIGQIRALEGEVRTYEDLVAAGVTGIGASIEQKIREVLLTGHLAAAAAIREDGGLDAKDRMMAIYGVGPVKAKELVEKHGLSTYAELRAAVAEGKIPKLLNDKQLIGLKYVEDFIPRIPRAEMDEHAALIQREIRRVDARFETAIVGSYRRGAEDSGDIDVLMTLPATVAEAEVAALFHSVCDVFKQSGYVIDELAQGDKKFMGVCKLAGAGRLARRIDLLVTPQSEYAYAVLYFTGSDKFNIRMRQHALEKGYTLNEHGLKRLKPDAPTVPDILTERGIFDFLDFPWSAPTDRSIVKKVSRKK